VQAERSARRPGMSAIRVSGPRYRGAVSDTSRIPAYHRRKDAATDHGVQSANDNLPTAGNLRKVDYFYRMYIFWWPRLRKRPTIEGGLICFRRTLRFFNSPYGMSHQSVSCRLSVCNVVATHLTVGLKSWAIFCTI